MTAPSGWLFEPRVGTAAVLHEPWPPAPENAGRVISCCEVTGPVSLVLGSAQGDDTADADALAAVGAGLVRRRSGGGAVVVRPGGQIWFDAWVPRGDALWQEDIVAGALWMGEAWSSALASLGLTATVHRGRATKNDWSGLVCFAGMGPGEVSVAGRKVVGLSQRRVRAGARLQSLALAHWEPAEVADMLAIDHSRRRRLVEEVAGAAAGLDVVLPGVADDHARLDTVAAAVLAHLPADA